VNKGFNEAGAFKRRGRCAGGAIGGYVEKSLKARIAQERNDGENVGKLGMNHKSRTEGWGKVFLER